jgi:hypothetical protein
MSKTKASRVFFALTFILLLSSAIQLQAENTKDDNRPAQISHGQRDLGAVILEDLSVTNGKIIFRTATGGCTDKASFQVRIKKEKGISDKAPNYALTIERIKIDECKAFFPDGVLIEFNLEKDLGLKGDFTVSVTNLIYPKVKTSG